MLQEVMIPIVSNLFFPSPCTHLSTLQQLRRMLCLWWVRNCLHNQQYWCYDVILTIIGILLVSCLLPNDGSHRMLMYKLTNQGIIRCIQHGNVMFIHRVSSYICMFFLQCFPIWIVQSEGGKCLMYEDLVWTLNDTCISPFSPSHSRIHDHSYQLWRIFSSRWK
jgi:hypothetical protein